MPWMPWLGGKSGGEEMMIFDDQLWTSLGDDFEILSKKKK